jgi:hypothetical protein
VAERLAASQEGLSSMEFDRNLFYIHSRRVLKFITLFKT